MAIRLIVIFLCLSLATPYYLNYHSKSRILQAHSSEDSEKIIHGGFNHCGIIVKDNEKSKKFFMDLFDFIDESHLSKENLFPCNKLSLIFLIGPPLPFPGSFLRFGNHQIHLMQLPNPDPEDPRPEYGGRDRHMAVWINNVDLVKRRLERENIAYNLSKSGRRSLFCRDLDGNTFEFVEDATLNN